MTGLSHLRRNARVDRFDDPKVAVLDRRPAVEERTPADDPFSAIRSIGALLEEMKAQMASEIARAEAAARKERDRADRLQDENDDLVAALAESRRSEQEAGTELLNLRAALRTLFAVANRG